MNIITHKISFKKNYQYDTLSWDILFDGKIRYTDTYVYETVDTGIINYSYYFSKGKLNCNNLCFKSLFDAKDALIKAISEYEQILLVPEKYEEI